MADFDFRVEDFLDDHAFLLSVTASQKGPTTPLRTSASVDNEVSIGVTMDTVSNYLQGSAVFKPEGLMYSNLNSLTSTHLKGLIDNPEFGGAGAVIGGLGS